MSYPVARARPWSAFVALLLSACAVTHPVAAPGTPASDVSWIDGEAYPFASRFLEVDGGRMHYVDEGSGPVVVLVHGTPTWSFLWRRLVRDLARDHRVIAMDHVGFGLSDKPAGWTYTPAAHAANVGRLLDALDLDDVTLVVHDFGGPIGLGAALDRPERVSRLVLMNTWMWALDERAEKLSKIVAGPLGRYLYFQRNASAKRLIPWAMARKDALTAEVHRHYTHPFPTPELREAPWRLGVELGGSGAWYGSLWERRAALAELPALLLWGMKDPTFAPDDLRRWQEALPNARTVELPDVGHFPQEEAPERVVAEVRGFLEGAE